MYGLLGRYAQANRYYGEALTIYRELGNRRGESAVLNNLGEHARVRGDYGSAIARYQEGLIIAREIGDRYGEVIYLSNLGGARVGLRDYAAAEADLRQVITVSGAESSWLSECYRFLAEACLGQGRVVEALEAAQRALALGQEIEDWELIGGAWQTLGNCGSAIANSKLTDSAILQSAIPDPPACCAESLRVFTEIGVEAERARTLRAWAKYELTQGDRTKGEAMWQEARGIFARLGVTLEVGRMDEDMKH